jgi:hypothetical protein
MTNHVLKVSNEITRLRVCVKKYLATRVNHVQNGRVTNAA